MISLTSIKASLFVCLLITAIALSYGAQCSVYLPSYSSFRDLPSKSSPICDSSRGLRDFAGSIPSSSTTAYIFGRLVTSFSPVKWYIKSSSCFLLPTFYIYYWFRWFLQFYFWVQDWVDRFLVQRERTYFNTMWWCDWWLRSA